MADVNTLPINGRAIARKYHDNGDGTWSEVIATVSAGAGADTNVSIDQTTPGTTNGVVVNSSALPTGAATAANQTVEITALQTIATNTTGPEQVVGNIADAVADSGNPVKTGGVYNLVAPNYTTGNRTTIQTDSNGSQYFSIKVAGAVLPIVSPTTDAQVIGLNLPIHASLRYYNGSTYDRARGDVNGLVNQPFAMTASRWQYAPPTGGIANSTTAVVVMAAAGAGVRNYMARLQITTSTLATGSEIVVLDGAAVIWRGYVGTVSGSQDHQFDIPLRGSANTSMLVQMISASTTGNVYCNAQGFQSAM